MLKPNTRLTESTLICAKPFISHWVIYAEELSKDDKFLIETILSDVPGIIITDDAQHYDVAINKLFSIAQQYSNWMLLLDGNEELCVLMPKIMVPTNANIGILQIERGDTIKLEARLFKSDAQVSFLYPTLSSIAFNNDDACFIPTFSVRGHLDSGCFAKGTLSNRFLLDAVLGKYEINAPLSLTLGEIELENGHLDLALTHFERIPKLAKSGDILWMAHYLAGGVYLSKANLPEALRQWHTAFELQPNRAEPLFRIAELHFHEKDYNTAALLAEQALEIEKPKNVDYLEPTIYEHKSTLLRAKAWHYLGHHEQARQSVKSLLDQCKNLKDRAHLKSMLAKFNESSSFSDNASNTQCIKPELNDLCPERIRPKLTIGMATHDDYDGVYFSVMNIVLNHRDCLEDIELLIIDNNPNSKHGAATRGLADRVPNMRYISAGEYQGTAIRELIFHEALGDYTLCMDCHVFLHAGVLKRLLKYFDANPNSKDLLHGPIFYDNHSDYSTHMVPEWHDGFYGRWAKDDLGSQEENPPFEIPMQGLGLFACVKQNWVGFNHKFRGFGGEEGYVHEKFRQHGGRVLCLPFLRWTHRFDRPNSPTYTNSWEDRIRNYLIGWSELGLEVSPVLTHFQELLGSGLTNVVYSKFLLEQSNQLQSFKPA